jgi:hypothetical protein
MKLVLHGESISIQSKVRVRKRTRYVNCEQVFWQWRPGKSELCLKRNSTDFCKTCCNEKCWTFDSDEALRAAELCADRPRRGCPVDVRDTMIVGIMLVTQAKLATRNVRHFDDIASSVVNPWE